MQSVSAVCAGLSFRTVLRRTYPEGSPSNAQGTAHMSVRKNTQENSSGGRWQSG